MHQIIKTGRFFFAAGIICLAVQQCIFGNFRPVIIPSYESWTVGKAICTYIFSAATIVAAIAIIIEKQARRLSLIFGGIMLVIFVLLLAPYQIFINQVSFGAYTQPLKGLAISGCFFVVAGSFPRDNMEGQPGIYRILEKLIPAGPVFYSIVMIVFGIEHFIYPDFVATLVPNWIPGHLFWTYFAGAALIASGLGIILRIVPRLAANLLGTAIFIWFIVLHIPRGIADPHSGDGNEWASVFEAFAFSGICFIMGATLPKGWSSRKGEESEYQPGLKKLVKA